MSGFLDSILTKGHVIPHMHNPRIAVVCCVEPKGRLTILNIFIHHKW